MQNMLVQMADDMERERKPRKVPKESKAVGAGGAASGGAAPMKEVRQALEQVRRSARTVG